MIELGFSEELIITKIKTTESEFDASIESLKELKNKGVTDAVIVEIMNSINDRVQYEEVDKPRRTGIYYVDDDIFQKILPTVFSGTKTNTLGASFSYGIASSKIKSVMNKEKSSNVINTSTPVFVFYFNTNVDDFNLGATNWWFNTASSPNEFALTKLDVKKNKRELVTGKVNVYSGASMGVDEKHAIPFEIEMIDDVTFKVYPSEPLIDGEYCFFYQGTIPQGGYTNQSVFDFSIQSAD